MVISRRLFEGHILFTLDFTDLKKSTSMKAGFLQKVQGKDNTSSNQGLWKQKYGSKVSVLIFMLTLDLCIQSNLCFSWNYQMMKYHWCKYFCRLRGGQCWSNSKWRQVLLTNLNDQEWNIQHICGGNEKFWSETDFFTNILKSV